MKSLFKYLLGAFSVLLFLVATTGVRMYSHHCSTSNTEHSSLFESLAICDNHNQAVEKVETVDTHSCCSQKSHPETPKPVKDDCCDDDSQFYKISVDFDLPIEGQGKLTAKELPVLSDSFTTKIGSTENDAISKWFIELYHPPPKSGKTLIVFLHQQKTDPPIA